MLGDGLERAAARLERQGLRRPGGMRGALKLSSWRLRTGTPAQTKRMPVASHILTYGTIMKKRDFAFLQQNTKKNKVGAHSAWKLGLSDESMSTKVVGERHKNTRKGKKLYGGNCFWCVDNCCADYCGTCGCEVYSYKEAPSHCAKLRLRQRLEFGPRKHPPKHESCSRIVATVQP